MESAIDIWMITYQRRKMTERAINSLFRRTKYPYRLFVIDNCSTDGTDELLDEFVKQQKVFLWLRFNRNVGIHMAHNTGLSLVDSDYCVSTDNDIYVPELEPCWLTRLVKLMDENKNFSAIACQPHVFLGRSDPEKTEEGVLEVGHCGAVMRIMRTDVVKRVGGWDRRYDANRNHEELTLCSRIQSIGGKVGYARDIRCYHDFGEDNNWGYGKLHPHKHGHRIPGKEIWPTPEKMKEQERLFDPLTWERR